MSGLSWKEHVASICRDAWNLDDRATTEVLRCVRDMIADSGISDSADVQVFLSVDRSEPRAGRSATTVRIRISAGATAPGESGVGDSSRSAAVPP